MARTKVFDSISHTTNNSVDRRKAHGGRGGSGGIGGRDVVQLDASAWCDKATTGRARVWKQTTMDSVGGAFPLSFVVGGLSTQCWRLLARRSVRRGDACGCVLASRCGSASQYLYLSCVVGFMREAALLCRGVGQGAWTRRVGVGGGGKMAFKGPILDTAFVREATLPGGKGRCPPQKAQPRGVRAKDSSAWFWCATPP